MIKQFLANASIALTHSIRQGTGSNSYTVVLSGVSCREVSGVRAGARTSSGKSFDPGDTTRICIFPGHTTAAPQNGTGLPLDAASAFLAPAAFKAAEEAQRTSAWTLAPEDKVQLPSGRTGIVTSVQDNRTGRCPHWYVEVT